MPAKAKEGKKEGKGKEGKKDGKSATKKTESELYAEGVLEVMS